MKHNTAILIILAIIISAGDRVIDGIESGKSPLVIGITGLVGAAVGVKLLMEKWQDRNESNPPPVPTSVPEAIIEGVKDAAEQVVTDAIVSEVTRAVLPKKRTPPSA